MSLGNLDHILIRDGFIIYIGGPKEKGKTDFSLLMAEYCYLKKFREKIATNIETESYFIEKQITNLPDLKVWLRASRKKLFILDEAGLSMPKLRFMSTMNLELMKLLQMIRHYDAGFIGIAPSTRNIDSLFMDTDILDAKIRKITKTLAQVTDYLENEAYYLEGIPKTSINFNSKHIAEFTMQRTTEVKNLLECCQVSVSYAESGSMKLTGDKFKLKPEQVRRLLREHIKHSMFTVHSVPVGNKNQENPSEPQNLSIDDTL